NQTVPKPFEQHCREASIAARAMALAVMQCDIFIVLCAPDGVGYHIETGVGLAVSIIMSHLVGQPQKRIFVIGAGNDRSIFYFDEAVERLDNIDELLAILTERGQQ